MKEFDFVIIGGGFFGMYIAEFLALNSKSVLLLEKDSDYMKRASLVNQARVHQGYHYPRSILTALRSKESFPIFVKEFSEAIVDNFEKYYAIAKPQGKVSSKQFYQFCKRIGIQCDPASNEFEQLFNPRLVESVFKTKEFAFDALILKKTMVERVQKAGVEKHLNAEVTKVEHIENSNLIKLDYFQGPSQVQVLAKNVYNCTYSMLNNVLNNSGLKLLDLKNEFTEMCLFNPPAELKGKSVTVMCGPFFSFMPYPSQNCYSLSHVRYTPHFEWRESDTKKNKYEPAYDIYNKASKETSWKRMLNDAARYMPILKGSEYKGSIWEVKTVLPKSESSDSRPILFKQDYCMPNFHCVLGGKIDNVYDVINVIKDNQLL